MPAEPQTLDDFLNQTSSGSDSDAHLRPSARARSTRARAVSDASARRARAAAPTASSVQPAPATAELVDGSSLGGLPADETRRRIHQLRELRLARKSMGSAPLSASASATASSAPAGRRAATAASTPAAGRSSLGDHLSDSDADSDDKSRAKSSWIKPKALPSAASAAQEPPRPQLQTEPEPSRAEQQPPAATLALPAPRIIRAMSDSISTASAMSEADIAHEPVSPRPTSTAVAPCISEAAADPESQHRAEQTHPSALKANPTRDGENGASSESPQHEPVSLDLDTTEDDKRRFFAVIKQFSGDNSLDYGALNGAMSDDNDDGDDLVIGDGIPLGDAAPSSQWLSALDRPSASSLLAALDSQGSRSHSRNDSISSLHAPPVAQPAQPLQQQPLQQQPDMTPMNAEKDTYSMSFESVSDIAAAQQADSAPSSRNKSESHDSTEAAQTTLPVPITVTPTLEAPQAGAYLTFEDFLALNNASDDDAEPAKSAPPKRAKDADTLRRKSQPQPSRSVKPSVARSEAATRSRSASPTKKASLSASGPVSSRIPTLRRVESAEYVQKGRPPQPKEAKADVANAKKQALKKANARFAAKTGSAGDAESRTSQTKPRAAAGSASSERPVPRLEAASPVAGRARSASSLGMSPSKSAGSLNRSTVVVPQVADQPEADLSRVLFRDSPARPASAVRFEDEVLVDKPSLAEPVVAAPEPAPLDLPTVLAPAGPVTPTSTPQVRIDPQQEKQLHDYLHRTVPIASVPPYVDVSELHATIHELRGRAAALKDECAAKDKENENMRDQVHFLERMLEEERETSQRAMLRIKSEPSITRAEADALRRELNDQENLIRGYQSENEKLTALVKTLRKDLKEADQRHFLRHEALQRENQTLRAQLGAVKGSGALDVGDGIEAAIAGAGMAPKSNGSVGATGASISAGTAAPAAASVGTAGERASFTAAKAQVRIEVLEQELASVRHAAQSKEADLRARIQQLEAQLAEASATVDALQGADPEKLKRLEGEFRASREAYEAYIVEIEGKLEMHMENLDLLRDAQRTISRQERAMADMRGEIERLEQTLVGGERRGGTATSASAKDRPGPAGDRSGAAAAAAARRMSGDMRRVRELERELEDLRAELERHRQAASARPTAADVSRVPRPVVDEGDYVRHLKQRVQRLQKESESASAESQGKIDALEGEIKSMRAQYERRIRELEAAAKDAEMRSAEDVRAARFEAESQAATRIRALEQELAAAARKTGPAAAAGTATQSESAGPGDDTDALETLSGDTLRDREIALRRRVHDLDVLVDDQAKRISQLVKERQQMEADAASRLREKDVLIESYEAKIVEMQQDFHHKVFAVDEHARMDEIHAMRLELESARAELAGVKNKLEISEGTRQAVHESTITILRQAQEESAKLALAHHERALDMLRKELRRSHGSDSGAGGSPRTRRSGSGTDGDHDAAIIRKLRQRVLTLEGELAAARRKAEMAGADSETATEAARLRDAVTKLESENRRLADALAAAKQGWPPAMHHFEALSARIRDLEESARRREVEITQLLEQTRGDYESRLLVERDRYRQMVKAKDREIIGFRAELDKVLDSIRLLRRRDSTKTR
ncbi:hypothetical protein HK105_203228 [Polyrhizophydium stewartii]|uniref:Centrosomal protein of 162 kDa n=1 Tax=Polyrhizophydium stewartii TaxID=2732419 RepID=A0ABR4NCL0_9FUNG